MSGCWPLQQRPSSPTAACSIQQGGWGPLSRLACSGRHRQRQPCAHGPAAAHVCPRPPTCTTCQPACPAPALPAWTGGSLPQGLQQPSGWPQPDGCLPADTCGPQHRGQAPNPFPLNALLAGGPAVPEQQEALCQPEGWKADLAGPRPGACVDAILPMSDDPSFAPLLDELLSWP